ncbi:MAG TPA: ATPase, T2SS/T4P/T4SS family [Candidatus Polarisedimenticolia bacterium]
MSQQKLGDLVMKAGLLDEAGVARVLESQTRDGGSLGRIAADLGLADEQAIAKAIAAGLGLPYADLSSDGSEQPALLSLPVEFCRKRLIVPLGIDGRALRLAMANPLDQSSLQDVEFRSGKWVQCAVATETAILSTLKKLDAAADEVAAKFELMSGVVPEGEMEAAAAGDYEVIDPAQLAKDVDLPPVVRLVNQVLTDAAKAGASDVHVEPQENQVQVRQRVDGMLHDLLRVPKNLQQAMISRLKIISGMDISERRKPQDGRSRLRLGDRKLDLRVSSIPTNFGEKIVVRLLDKSDAQIDMAKIGFDPDLLATFQALLRRPQGMILVTGPTGSGKTTTLYAALNWVKSATKNIITVEDPIEYELPGINQVQINTRAGVTFAAGLRSILRQDPNIVLVGEIRDRETAGIALEASQTGHLLLSTLHTNDAPSSITRLFDLGIEPFMVASSIGGILAQRLVRKICSACAIDRPPAAETLARLGGPDRLPAGGVWKAGQGCDQCGQSGYRGRLAIHELLMVTDEVRHQIANHASDQKIREAGRRGGMHLLVEDGIDKAARGVTTLEEVLRLAPLEESWTAGGAKARGVTAAHDGSAADGPPAAVAAGAPVTDAAPVDLMRDGAKPRVLIVEDSPTVVTVVKYFLELEGFEVLVAEDGLTGLEMARTNLPEVLVSDLNMPGMDGIALVEALRKGAATGHMAILMLTSESSLESEAKGLAIGADDYITKPVEPRRLAARVKAVLARSRARQKGAA